VVWPCLHFLTTKWLNERPKRLYCDEITKPIHRWTKCRLRKGADKSLARPGRKQANVSARMAWISSGALPCRKKNWQLASRCCWNRARPWPASELVSFLVGISTYQHPSRELTVHKWGTRWRSRLRHRATSRKVAGSIPDGVTQFFRPHYGPGADSASSRKEYQQSFLGGKGGRSVRITFAPSCADCLEIWELQTTGTLKACPGL